MSNMEEDLMNSMIKERDARISVVKMEIHHQKKKITALEQQLKEIRLEKERRQQQHQARVRQMMLDEGRLEVKMKEIHREQKQSGALHMYADILRSKSESVDSSYVVRMQSQLCKAMHTMGIAENQMELVKTHCSNMIKLVREEITRITDTKCKMEVEIMNELVVMDSKKQEAEKRLNEFLEEQKQGGTKKKNLDEIEEGESDEDDSDEDYEDDSEEESEDDEDDSESEEEEDDEEAEKRKGFKEELNKRRETMDQLRREAESMQEEWEEMQENLRTAVESRNRQILQKDEEIRVAMERIEQLKNFLLDMNVQIPQDVLDQERDGEASALDERPLSMRGIGHRLDEEEIVFPGEKRAIETNNLSSVTQGDHREEEKGEPEAKEEDEVQGEAGVSPVEEETGIVEGEAAGTDLSKDVATDESSLVDEKKVEVSNEHISETEEADDTAQQVEGAQSKLED